MTTETNNVLNNTEYEYELWQHGAWQAGGRENDYASAQSEANHYAMLYAHDGPVEVRIYEKRLLSAAKVRPKRRRYDPYGSLSEYGIFPECDAQQPAEEGERDWLAPAMDEMAEWRMDALEAGSEDGLQAEVEAQESECPPTGDEVVFIDGVGAGRSSIKSCHGGVQWIRVGDRIYWPLSDSDAKRLHSACCGNGSFDGPTTHADEAMLQKPAHWYIQLWDTADQATKRVWAKAMYDLLTAALATDYREPMT